MITACLVGEFPRSEHLIEATRAFERERLDAERLQESFTKDAAKAIELQEKMGYGHIIDGLLNWQDLLRPIASVLRGVELGPLTRWYDNNTFYRKPLISDRVENGGPVDRRYFRTDLLPKGKIWKAILPGPYTFLRLSDIGHYKDYGELLLDMAHALSAVTKDLLGRGFKAVQFSEPSLAVSPLLKDDIHLVRQAYEILSAGGGEISLQTYFGDASGLFPHILDFPVDFIGVDFYDTSLDDIAQYEFSKGLVCGCVDGRNSLVETSEEMAFFAERALESLEPPRLLLSPTCELGYLPREIAQEKVRNLARAVELLKGGRS